MNEDLWICIASALCDSQRIWSTSSLLSGNMTSLHFQATHENSLITAGFLRRGVSSLEEFATADTSWIVPRTCRILIESSQKDIIIQQLKNKISNIQKKNGSMQLDAGMRAAPEKNQEDHWMYGFTGRYFVSDDVMDKLLKSESNMEGEKKEYM